MEIYKSVRGTTDFSPQQAAAFNSITAKARELLRSFSYEEIILPLLEEEGLFVRSVGATSDIAEKQLFRIADKDGICLRPEGTAQVVRYFLENSLHRQGDFYKFFYIGPMFRGERPQKGRLRQFHHIGCEALGGLSPYLDAETIILAARLLSAIGLNTYEIKLNTLGCAEDKEKFALGLKGKLQEKRSSLCEDCRRRLDKNPLRILDCKNRDCKSIVAGLPSIDEALCPACNENFTKVLKILDEAKIKYLRDKNLVRGLDYYTNTVFEITSSALGAQDAVGAGGRYNRLVENLGGPQIPAVGFALGIERLLIALGEKTVTSDFNVFVAPLNDTLRDFAFSLTMKLREAGINADTDYCFKSLKSQFRLAQRKGARLVVVVGEDEMKDNCVMVKDMLKGEQSKVSVDKLIETIKNMM